MTIRSYLVALILSIFVPSTIFAGVIAYKLAEGERTASLDGLRSTARALTTAVDRNIDEVSNSVSVLAAAELLRVRELEGFHRYARRIIENRPALARLVLVEPDGRILLDTDTPYGSQHGRMKTVELDRAIATGQPVIGPDVSDYGLSDSWAITLFVPARVDGEIRYALIAFVSPAIVSTIFDDQKLPKDWTGVLLDNRASILGRSRSAEAFIGTPAPKALASAIAAARDGIAQYATQEGQRTVAAFQRSPLTGWTMVLGMPAGLAEISARNTMTIVVIAGFGVSALALALAAFLGRRISQSVLGLLEPAEAIARGEAIPSPVRSEIVEIQRVAEKLKTAADILRDRERQREQAEERYRLASLATSDFIWELDVRARRTERSANFYAAFGYDPTDAEVTSFEWWRRHLHPDDRARVMASVDELFASDRNDWCMEYRLQKADGSYANLLDRAYCVRDAQGEVQRVVGAKIDLTALKRVEEQLRQTQKMEALGQLTGGVAHDFNNLLAVIVGNLDLAVKAQRRGELALALDEASLQAAIRGAALTRQLLAFARRQQLRPQCQDLRQLVGGMVPILEPALTKKIALILELPDAPCWIEIDSGQFQAALINLAINARDAMPRGGALKIAVGPARRSEAGAAATDGDPFGADAFEVAVTDTGCGMTGEVLAHAFEPFFTTKEIGRGSGLGLSMVYGFVRQSGGEIALESKPGQGTTVRLLFKRAAAPSSDAATAKNAPATSLKDRSVLLVEDDAEVREALRSLLDSLGATVVPAADGRAAFEILNSDRPLDMMLTDVVMPGGMDGIDLAECAHRLRPDVKIAFMSGNAELDQRALRSIEGRPLLTKPFRSLELAAALEVL